jgi:hypothetical protein
MELSKPPTMEELVDFDIEDFYNLLYTPSWIDVNNWDLACAPYFQKCNDDDGDYFLFFMLKLIRNNFVSILPRYLQQHREQNRQHPSLGGKLLNLCFELEKNFNRPHFVKLVWKKDSVTLYLYHNPEDDVFEIPVQKMNSTDDFPYTHITVYVRGKINMSQI